jgi:hypothetical protein
MKYLLAFILALGAIGLCYLWFNSSNTSYAPAQYGANTQTSTGTYTTQSSGSKTTTQKSATYPNPQPTGSNPDIAAKTFAVTSTIGPPPFTVTYSTELGWGMTINFGDGSKKLLPNCVGSCSAEPIQTTHTYTTPGTYTASLINQGKAISTLQITVRY